MKKQTAILIIILAAGLVMWTLETPSRAASPRPAGTPRVVAITAHRFEFVPDHVTLKKDEPVVLQVTSEDVTHGFFSRPLKIDEEVQAGHTQRIPLTPRSAGTYALICDHFCGANHGNMRMTIEVVE